MKRSWQTIPVFLIVILVGACLDKGPGCTDPMAANYDPEATSNDGSCTYPSISLSPETSFQLDDRLSGNSGLMLWDGYLWTHNDNGASELFGLGIPDGELKVTLMLGPGENLNWEEIAQDRDYIYVGAFGNNASGNRSDLNILRVEKETLKSGNPEVDTIWFTYQDQVDMSPEEPNQTDFDCEAFLVTGDSIFLFTKQWISAQTTVYSLSKTPGRYVAQKGTTFPVDGMVTGVAWMEAEHLAVFCGYTILLQPFLFLMYDFDGTAFFSGNKRRVNLSLPFHQVEGIATGDGLIYYISNESFAMQLVANTPQKLHKVDLTKLLAGYLNKR